MNRRFWMWVLVVPAVILSALAVAGDSLILAARLWWLSAPVLGGLGVVYWFALGPAEKPPADAPPPKLEAADIVFRLVGIVVLLALTVIGVGLLIAAILWLKPYWLILGPVYGGFALFLLYGLVKDELAERRAKKEAQIVR